MWPVTISTGLPLRDARPDRRPPTGWNIYEIAAYGSARVYSLQSLGDGAGGFFVGTKHCAKKRLLTKSSTRLA